MRNLVGIFFHTLWHHAGISDTKKRLNFPLSYWRSQCCLELTIYYTKSFALDSNKNPHTKKCREINTLRSAQFDIIYYLVIW